MKRLPITAPDVYEEFIQGNHPIRRSSQSFYQVCSDQALEQTANRDSKTKGGIIGKNLKPGALNRWFLTAHKRADAT